jgi:anti-anti-sigma factor
MSEGVNILTEYRNGINIIRVKNVVLLDPALADSMTRILVDAFEAGDQKVLVDIASVTRMTSLFFRSFIIAGKKAKAKCATMAFCNVSPTIKEGFDMMGLGSYFAIYDKEAVAIEHLK